MFKKKKKKRLNINYFRNIPFTNPPHAQSRGKFLGLAVRLHVHDFNKPCLQARLTAYVTPAESIAWVKAVSRLATDNKKKKRNDINEILLLKREIYHDKEQVQKQFHLVLLNNSNDDLEIDVDILQYLYLHLFKINNYLVILINQNKDSTLDNNRHMISM
jgi:hypothetical protein